MRKIRADLYNKHVEICQEREELKNSLQEIDKNCSIICEDAFN
jgi:hypothetical protein